MGKRNAPLVAAAAVMVLCALAVLLHLLGTVAIPGLALLELATVDLRYSLRGTRTVPGDVVVVTLDDALRQRDRAAFMKHAAVAEVIRAIEANHPRAVAVDLFFDSPDAVLPPGVLLEVKNAREEALAVAPDRQTPPLKHATAALGDVLDASRGDEELARALRTAGNVDLAALFFLNDERLAPPPGTREPAGLHGAAYDESAFLDRALSRRPPRAEQLIYASIAPLAEAARGAGYVNVAPDRDGRVREVFGAIEYAGNYYLPLGFSLARHSPGAGAFAYATNEPAIRFGERRLPVDERGRLLLDWPGPWGTFPWYSAADVLDGKIPPGSLEGKLVLVGLTDAARDRVQTPFGEQPGVSVHAVLAEGALHDGFLRATTPRWTLALVVLLAAIPTVLQIRAVRSRGAWIPAAAGLGGAVIWSAAAQILFSREQVIAPVAAPSLAAIVTAVAALGAALATEEREKRRLRSAFSRYVSDVVADRILESPEAAGLEGVRREVTVLFSDIRGFSEFSERLEPEVLRRLLVEYFTPMSD
ncbi:MAG TPA: CHASE2 domain-containing protein, partial [bacterium]|nr:CHASE2 domain-containing protein [bacterium]